MRADLLALTPEALARLANVGLVKRARREIDAGRGPTLSERADGAVTGVFADGVTTELPPGGGLEDGRCSCGARMICRHRIAVALAYPDWQASRAPIGPRAWSPRAIDDDALRRALGGRTLARARARVSAGLTVEVRRDGPAAALPTCTVRFLVPDEIDGARCDCDAGGGCEHVAAAVWAFREADGRAPGVARAIVTLGRRAPARAGGPAALDEAVALADEILLEGAVHAPPAAEDRLRAAAAGLERAALAWPAAVETEMAEALADYRRRSARYRPVTLANLLVELRARARAASGAGALPADLVLGAGEIRETRLEQVRLVSLGARVEADGDAREVEVFLAHPGAATVLVLRRRFEPSAGEGAPDGAALAGRLIAPGVRLGPLATGQVVTRAARRRPDRLLVLGGRPANRTTVVAQTGDWGSLPPPIRVTDLAAWAEARRGEPPRPLRPRVLAERLHVLPVEAVEGVAYAPAAQAIHATLRCPGGAAVRLTRRHRAAAPRALEVIAATLLDAARPVRFVAGDLRRGRGGWEIDPVGLVAEGLVVPDLAPASAHPALPALPIAGGGPPASEPEAALRAAQAVLAEAAHRGLRHVPPTWAGEVRAAARRLEAAGLVDLAARLGAVTADRGATAWVEAALRVALALEIS